MRVPFVPELFCDIDYDKTGKLLSVPESKTLTEAGFREKLARVLTKGETLDNDNNPLKLPFLGRSFIICVHSDMPTALANVKVARQIIDEYSRRRNCA